MVQHHPISNLTALTSSSNKRREQLLTICGTDAEKKYYVRAVMDSPKLHTALDYPEDQAPASAVRLSEVIKAISVFRQYVGATKLDNPKVLQREAVFVARNYGELSIDELKWVPILFTTRRLLPHRNSFLLFSCDFLGTVLNDYQRFSQEIARELSEKCPPLPTPATTVTPLSQLNNMKFFLREIHAQISSGQPFVFFINEVYEFLKRTGRIDFKKNADLANRAVEWANQRIQQINRQGARGQNRAISDILLPAPTIHNKEQYSQMQRRLAREFCIREFLRSASLTDLVDQITIKDFNVAAMKRA